MKNEALKPHLRTIYRGLHDLLEWRMSVSDALEDLLQALPHESFEVPQEIQEKLDALRSSLGQTKAIPLALEAIDTALVDLSGAAR